MNTTFPSRLSRSLLWIDSGGGLLAGTLTLLLARWMSSLSGLPLTLVTVMGAANLVYGLFSLSLARRRARPPALLIVLVVANGLWATLCVILALLLNESATMLGTFQLISEALFVGGLSALEWRHRVALQSAG
ncbi:MAG TPA: hypothetical protein VE869_13890 [Gemmatimonas sp.]|nr:hypothetical protein [Gemmatimonas sp.]